MLRLRQWRFNSNVIFISLYSDPQAISCGEKLSQQLFGTTIMRFLVLLSVMIVTLSPVMGSSCGDAEECSMKVFGQWSKLTGPPTVKKILFTKYLTLA